MIKFKYERLGNFCYFCGMLGHIEDYCEKLYSIASDDGIRNWGPELRVEKLRNNGGIQVQRDGAPHEGGAASGSSIGINAHSITALPKVANFASLANMLHNPHLIRPASQSLAAITAQNNEILLMEDHNDDIIANKAKRSRELKIVDGKLKDSGQQQKVLTENDSAPSSITKPETSSNSVTPMDVTQSSTFLSAGPGSQARWES